MSLSWMPAENHVLGASERHFYVDGKMLIHASVLDAGAVPRPYLPNYFT